MSEVMFFHERLFGEVLIFLRLPEIHQIHSIFINTPIHYGKRAFCPETTAEMLFMLDCIRMFTKGQGDMCTLIRPITPDLRAFFHLIEWAQGLRALIMSWHSSSLQFRCSAALPYSGLFSLLLFLRAIRVHKADNDLAAAGSLNLPPQTFNPQALGLSFTI